MKKFTFILLVLTLALFCGCSLKKEELLKDHNYELYVGDEVSVGFSQDDNLLLSNLETIQFVSSNVIKGVKPGTLYVSVLNDKRKVKETYEVVVKSLKYSTDRSCIDYATFNNMVNDQIEVGEIKEIPTHCDFDLIVTSTNSNVLTVIDNRYIVGVSSGTVTLKIESPSLINYYESVTVKVTEPSNYLKLEDNVIGVSEEVSSEVVTVFNYQIGKNYDYALYAMGSGVIYKIINDDIFILTNRHVVKDSDKLYVHFANSNKKIPARLIAYDDMVDLAVIAVNRSKVDYSSRIKECHFAYSDNTKVGQFVLTVGSPMDFELEGTVCLGIVSKKAVYLEEDIDEDGKYEYFNKYIQVDAAINSGNSGGPLFDLNGHVVGINTAKIDSSYADNLAFSIPTDIILAVLDRLENASKREYKTLGISCYDVNKIIEYDKEYDLPDDLKNDENAFGVVVTDVLEDSLADKAGILEGDIIRKINDVNVYAVKHLLVEFFESNIKDRESITLDVLRDDAIIHIEINLNEKKD